MVDAESEVNAADVMPFEKDIEKSSEASTQRVEVTETASIHSERGESLRLAITTIQLTPQSSTGASYPSSVSSMYCHTWIAATLAIRRRRVQTRIWGLTTYNGRSRPLQWEVHLIMEPSSCRFRYLIHRRSWVLNAFYICYVIMEWTTVLWKILPAHVFVACLCAW